MQKVLDFVMTKSFITGAIIGGVALFAVQVFLVGDMPFLWFWVINALGAAGGGALFKALAG